MTSQADKAERFLALHRPGSPLLLGNVWDAGSAKLLASLGFDALATTSSGFAATLGRLDGEVTRAEAIAHSRAIADATDLPVSADLERCFADEPDGVAETIALAIDAGLAGCSVEDFTGDRAAPIYDLELAVARVAAAAETAHAGPVHFVLTARAENHLHGRTDLDDTIARLRAFEAVGADVLFAPGLGLDEVRQVRESVSSPVNFIARPGGPTVAELSAAGVARISVGGSLAWTAFGAVADAAREWREAGTFGWLDRVAPGRTVARRAFGA
ncbi:MAG TPA: isocitrate lyase/phosphoenolpyruvate mutase family protein [Acidimicrobiales bacterium]|jgi:2-methylisocitrate lyase-like PEP mutase family enzyme|nr:isocitrate lyase/phosphoenolpyruvate mutase family protein [Acidimicrobiales bacterium]